jgi:uncharacterized spore protein YtfJ
MGRNDAARRGPWRVEMIRGEPYRAGGRTLIPVAQVISFGRARATVGTRQIGGWGAGFAHLRPVAVEEETAEGVRHIPIADPTARFLRVFLSVAVATTLCCAAIRWLAQRGQRAGG